ncbi:MAG TPA: cation:proton antiporter [Thermoanaerobaculia bacterium]
MHESGEFLRSLAVVLCVAAVTTVLFQRLRQPVVLGYILAGLIVGPYVPVPLVADPQTIQTLSELGVILLMFFLGLEFSLKKLARVGGTATIVAVLQVGILIWLGYTAGRLLGWTKLEAFYAGAMISISSTTIIAKAFEEQKVSGRLREIVFAVLIVEDLVAILLLTGLTTVSSGQSMTLGSFAATAGRLLAFLAVLLIAGMYLVPRLMRMVLRANRPEMTLVASVGLCFAASLAAHEFGYSVALGAFLAGSLLAEAGVEKVVEPLVRPVRDMFAAIFFVAVGMMIDPGIVAAEWRAVLVFTAVVVLGNIVGVGLGAFLTGAGIPLSVRAGMSLAQIGEFSFIIAALGVSLGAVRGFLYPVAVAVSAITTLLTPWLIRFSGPAAAWVDHRLPPRLQTFVALYGSWVERLTTAKAPETAGARRRRLIWLLLLDTACLVALLIGFGAGASRAQAFLVGRTGLDEDLAGILWIAAGVLFSLPLLFGLVRGARALALLLAGEALPAAPQGQLDLADAPRRAFVIALQIVVLLALGIPVVALTQPFLPGVPVPLLLLALVGGALVTSWKAAANLDQHYRAGAQAVLEVLAAQPVAAGTPSRRTLDAIPKLLPGLGDPVSVPITPGCPAEGRSLAELDVRGRTGASVIAVKSAKGPVMMPGGDQVLRAGDVVVLVGSHRAVDAASRGLSGEGDWDETPS